MMMDLIWRGVVIGFGATVLMDIWAVILWKVFGQGAPNWAMVGRWCWHLPSGKVFHDDIGKAAPYAHEQALGWIFHYAVGIAYGVILALLMGGSCCSRAAASAGRRLKPPTRPARAS